MRCENDRPVASRGVPPRDGLRSDSQDRGGLRRGGEEHVAHPDRQLHSPDARGRAARLPCRAARARRGSIPGRTSPRAHGAGPGGRGRMPRGERGAGGLPADRRRLVAAVRRIAVSTMAIVALLAAPSPALAHGLLGRLESPLPLAVYLAGAAMAVALSFAFVILRDVRAAADRTARTVPVPRPVVVGLRAVGLLAWAWIVAQAIVGGSSNADVASLFLWVYGWVGVAAVSAFAGPVWTWLDPFTTLFDIGAAVLRRLGVAGRQPPPYPARLRASPAVLGLTVFLRLRLSHRGRG